MADYQVLMVSGDYPDRQAQANAAGCDGYLEHHFNALAYDRPGTSDNPCFALVAHNASDKSKAWAKDYADRVADDFGWRSNGVVQVGHRARGDYNLRFTDMPAILVEPLFVSDVEQAAVAQSEDGQERLARHVVDSIKAAFPNGGKFALSIGHKGKDSSPYDTGAPVVDSKLTEADLSEQVITRVARMLVADTEAAESGCKCPNCGHPINLS
jgi:hypothetical protein